MSEVHIMPDELVASLLCSDVAAWVMAGGDRSGQDRLDGQKKSLVPAMQLTANSVLGIGSRRLENPRVYNIVQEDQRRLRLWFSQKDKYPPDLMKRTVGSLGRFSHMTIITCSGNVQGVCHRFIVHKDDGIALHNLLSGVFPHGKADDDDVMPFAQTLRNRERQKVAYRMLCPGLPYWGVFDAQAPELAGIYPAIMGVPESGYAVYEVCIVPLPPEYAAFVKTMQRAEEIAGERLSVHRKGWILSGEAYRRVQDKVAGGLYALTVRIAVMGDDMDNVKGTAESLLMPIASLRFSGSPLEIITERDMSQVGINNQKLIEGLLDGTTYQHGSIVSASEAALFIPLPREEDVGNMGYMLDRTPLLVSGQSAERGILIGEEWVCGKRYPLVWPDARRAQHMFIGGESGSGKTMELAAIAARIVDDEGIGRNEGVAMIDPHHKAIPEFVCRAPESRLGDFILLDPMDTEYVFCLPLLDCADPSGLNTAVSNIVHQLFSVFSRSETGFVIERWSRIIMRTCLQCRKVTLPEICLGFYRGGKTEELTTRICSELKDSMLIEKWQHEFPLLDMASRCRISNRMDHFLEIDSIRAMLINRVRKVTYRDLVGGNKIFLVNTCAGNAGADAVNMLSTLELNGLLTAANSRAGEEGRRPIYSIIADEFGNYANPRTMPHSLRTLRRCDVSVILVAQNVTSLSEEMRQSLGNVDTHIVLNEGWSDAQEFFKTFCGLVPSQEFMMKDPGDGYAKIGRHLATITCPLEDRLRGPEVMEEIRANTRRQYCIPRQEFQERLIDEHDVSLEDMKELDLI